ncbi:nuclease-related domain-containing protein [Salinicoccus carnicancri]|uniref:nuclease-related domain-containing protein n=1 Tax=Salinicoccus carnicancri TaxID=558170 RepID=UPI00030632DD|nr:nuclease-related domain-containing protein [Salinicoccus carnicancri]
MFLNIRQKPQELIYHEALSNRSILSDKEQRKLAALSSGHAGECEYDRLFDAAGHGGLLIYRDIWMKVDEAVIQADSLIVADGVVAVDEVKNFSGDYKYAGGEWTVRGRPGYEDPLAQVSRTAGRLVRLGGRMPYRFDVQKKVVFVNPDMNLEFNSEENQRFIVGRSRLRDHFKALGRLSAGPAAHENARAFRRFFIRNPMPLPVTDFKRIRMGNYCYACGVFDLHVGKYKVVCRRCGYTETTERMFVRSLIDFSVLFHDRKMTSAGMSLFVSHVLKPRTVRKYLSKYCHVRGSNRATYYVIKSIHLKKLLSENGYASKYETDERFRAADV